MKYLLIVFMLVALLVTPAFAADEGNTETGSTPNYVTVAAPDVYVTVEDNTPTVLTVANETGSSIRSSFEDAIVAIFGEYTPRTQTVIVQQTDGTTIEYEEYVTGLAGLDWVWIASVGLFALFLFCLMRLLGGAVK